MKQAIILHGLNSGPNEFWLPWLADELKTRGFSVFAPQLPQKDAPDLKVWTPYVLQHATLTPDTVIIGHSAGCPLTLDLLQKTTVRIARAILVAGFATQLPNMPDDHPMLLKSPDWEKMKRDCADFVFIHSDNDPWGCVPAQGEYMRQRLGGTLVTMTNQIHFGSNVFKQTYPTFPLVRDFCIAQ